MHGFCFCSHKMCWAAACVSTSEAKGTHPIREQLVDAATGDVHRMQAAVAAEHAQLGACPEEHAHHPVPAPAVLDDLLPLLSSPVGSVPSPQHSSPS